MQSVIVLQYQTTASAVTKDWQLHSVYQHSNDLKRHSVRAKTGGWGWIITTCRSCAAAVCAAAPRRLDALILVVCKFKEYCSLS